MEVNRHHLIHPRRFYRSKTERAFRTHPFMVHKMEVEAHKELHAVIQPPLKLAAQDMAHALCLLEEMNGEPLQAFERINHLADYLAKRTLREQRVAANLRLQADYVEVYGV